MKKQIPFYSGLLEKWSWNELEVEKLLQNIDNKTGKNEKQFCEKIITEKEVSEIIKSFKTDKSSGENGIIADLMAVL